MLGVTTQTPFTYLVHFKDLNFVLGGGGWGKNLVKAVFMCVYRRLAANSIHKASEKGEVSQNLLARIVALRSAPIRSVYVVFDV